MTDLLNETTKIVSQNSQNWLSSIFNVITSIIDFIVNNVLKKLLVWLKTALSTFGPFADLGVFIGAYFLVGYLMRRFNETRWLKIIFALIFYLLYKMASA